MKNKQLKIEERDVNSLKPYENNPRRNEKAIAYVKKSIEEFGFKVPLVIDKDGVIVCGHTRYKAAQQLKLKTVPCIVADDLTEEQINAFRLADNKTAEMAEWDYELLNVELGGMENINMSDFGFIAIDDLVLDVNDEDFLKDTEITKEKKPKTIICPHCGEEIEV